MRFRFIGFVTFVGLVGAFGSGSSLLYGQSSEAGSRVGHNEAFSAARSQLTKPRIISAPSELPPSFELNAGQTNPRVRFLARGANYGLFLADREAILVFGPSLSRNGTRSGSVRSGGASQQQPSAASHRLSATGFRIQLAGANPDPDVKGIDELPGTSNYLMGSDPGKWHSPALEKWFTIRLEIDIGFCVGWSTFSS